ncbi:Na+/H+ antiporter NhaA [Mucilaginibacter myungsuensis]|uniref:Na(+)/H(+) antiporter NhaA n=1 Tax=Mucilaginibacter myungsuensis TaxID=649104 RepID=A0A929KWH6_9SPHI|nr:Na+/H+ antiporter NhaA [Mucilaginibacter myungsuensis]MBE9662457.1 Na+/H+ antiporter NhaA [Mucilaginibacter myungsuensis]MDN3597877.1 Na+/H+ antiporter NhaA [Mucilaginibacter myungsuensis]
MKLSALFKSDSASGVILIFCVLIALLIANSPLAGPFNTLLAFRVDAGILDASVLEWINDGLMTIFFFFVGMEIKQEMISGHLSSFKKASVPVLAAIGGALVPALIYTLLNRGTATTNGWGIPMATDIAFALGVLSLMGKLVPPALKAFLSTLAVVDDLLAIVVIAIFYATDIHLINLFIGSGIFIALLIMNKLGVKRTVWYIVPGVVMWYFIHHSGIHATVAGVLTAMAIPYASKKGSPLKDLVHLLEKPVAFVIMPLFAIANTNIHFTSDMAAGITSMLGVGIIAGLIIGKPIGIMAASWLCVKAKIGHLPHGVNWRMLAGIGLLAGIGFTMSIFMSFLSFDEPLYNAQAKLAILIASAAAGTIGYIYLKKILKPKNVRI